VVREAPELNCGPSCGVFTVNIEVVDAERGDTQNGFDAFCGKCHIWASRKRKPPRGVLQSSQQHRRSESFLFNE
jgi:hypothetical protein